jgi:hypothetical protein
MKARCDTLLGGALELPLPPQDTMKRMNSKVRRRTGTRFKRLPRTS